VLWIYAEAPQLDSLGRVIDFSELKNRIGGWIDQHLDHSFIVFEEDKKVIDFVNEINNKKPYILKSNPTAENIASHLLESVIPELMKDTEIIVSKLELFETENCSVEVKKYSYN
ncbi:MAG: 6-pyruvoyl trahydropterin synthase family protein, partial [Candidatus Sericytochromatia bacterium]